MINAVGGFQRRSSGAKGREKSLLTHPPSDGKGARRALGVVSPPFRGLSGAREACWSRT